MAVQEGRLDEKSVDECLDRLIDLILETDGSIKASPKKFDVEAHHAFAEKCAEESIVLLKNEKNILPLKKKERIALIGEFAERPRYQGAGVVDRQSHKAGELSRCGEGKRAGLHWIRERL